MQLKEFIIAYLVFINLISFICFFIDKRLSIKKSSRISESTLILLSILGGSIGSFLGMKIFHHKTRKNKFIFGIPIILVINVIILFYIDHLFII